VNESKKRFVRDLIAADPPSVMAGGRHEKEIRAMLEKTLTPRQRGIYLIAGVAAFFPAALFALGALQPHPAGEFVMFLWVYVMATAVVLAALAVLLFRAYWSGVIVQRPTRRWAAGLGVAYSGMLGWLFMLAARHTPEILREDVRVLGLVLLVYAAVAWIRSGVGQAELRTAERLLEIELRLAEIGEKQKAPQPPDSPPETPGNHST
jgi:hypothetical protein